MHSLAESKNDIIGRIAESISKNFNVSIEEALEKCSVLITGLFVHTLHVLIIEKMENGEELAKKFLDNIARSDSEIKEIHNMYGDMVKTKGKFKEILEDYLGVPTEHTLSDFYYHRVMSACESIVELVNKETDKIDLKDGVFDYAESAKREQSVNKTKRKTRNNLS